MIMLGAGQDEGKASHNITGNPTIVVDGRMLFERGTGVSSYNRSLVHALAGKGVGVSILADRTTLKGRTGNRIDRWRRDLRSRFKHGRKVHEHEHDERGRLLAGYDIFREAQVFFERHGATMPIRLPQPPGIMHWCFPVPIHAVGWTNIYTIHDAIPITYPELTPMDGARYRRRLDAIVRQAAALITVSDDSASSISAMLGRDAPPLYNCGLALDVPADSTGLPEGLEPGGYFICVGTIEPRKNLERLAAAYAASGSRRPLMIAGPKGWQADRLVNQLATIPGVHIMPWLERPELVSVMRHARAVLFPSLAEGFGLPIAESFALDVPVLTSNRGATAEVAGDAALLVDPEDVANMAAGIALLDQEDALCASLIKRGRAQVARFSPEAFADRLIAVYAAHGP